ncbi:MAG: CGGC domain-containing protein [Bacillota bacterium]
MKRVAIFTCKKIRDISCVACLKCFKAAELKDGEFGRHEDEVKIVAMTNCGDCPGLVMPRAQLLSEMADYLERDIDAVHIGTCMVKAVQTAGCPIDLEGIKKKLETKFKEVVIGTHNY